MYRSIVRRVVPPLIGRLIGRGDIALARWLFTKDAEFAFPGRHSWAAHYHSREQITDWLRRFTSLRPEYNVRQVLVDGPPWDTRVAVHFDDRIGTDYHNEGVQLLRLRWGRIARDQVFLDTQRINDWEAGLPDGPYGPGGEKTPATAH